MSGIDKNTVLMLHMNDDTFKDECGHTVVNDGVKLDTNNKVFGNGSAYCKSTTLTIDSSDFAFKNNDFTIDFWMYYISGYCGVSSVYIGSGIGVGIQSDYIWIGSNSTKIVISPANFIMNKWTHYALVRAANEVYYFVNGKLINTSVCTTSIVNTKLKINDRYGTGYNPGQGYIDEFRISNIARYTTEFTPPIHEYTKDLYLVKQNDNYYSIQNNTLTLLGTPTDDTQKEEWFNTYGIDNINNLCKKYNIESFVSQGEALGEGKLFTFDIPSDMKNINNVD